MGTLMQSEIINEQMKKALVRETDRAKLRWLKKKLTYEATHENGPNESGRYRCWSCLAKIMGLRWAPAHLRVPRLGVEPSPNSLWGYSRKTVRPR